MSSATPPNSLIVVADRITGGRIQALMRHRGWESTICDDGDLAVDEYVRLKPNLVFMGLDLPTMDGHVAALEMRETDPGARIVFVTSRTRRHKAADAAFSAGAVAVLTTPLTQSDFDENWIEINGPIPEAPGLADLDDLYPSLPDKAPGASPPLPEHPSPEALPPMPEHRGKSPNQKLSKLYPWLSTLALLTALALALAIFFGYIEV